MQTATTDRSPRSMSRAGVALELRAQPKVYVVFGLILSLPAALVVMELLRGKHGSSGALFCLVGLAPLIVVWLLSYRLQLSEQRLKYRCLFGGKHDLALDEIEFAYSEYGGKRCKRRRAYVAEHYSDYFLPTNRIVIRPTAQSGKRKFCINVPIFNPDDVRVLWERLEVEPLPEE